MSDCTVVPQDGTEASGTSICRCSRCEGPLRTGWPRCSSGWTDPGRGAHEDWPTSRTAVFQGEPFLRPARTDNQYCGRRTGWSSVAPLSVGSHLNTRGTN